MVGLAREQRVDLLRSINAAEDAASSTAASVEAALRSARAAEESSHIERAWMIYDNYWAEPFESHYQRGVGEVGKALGIRITWRNGGRSPALGCKLCIQGRWVGLEQSTPDFKPKFPNGFGAAIGQNKTIYTESYFIWGAGLTELKDESRRLVLYAAIEYRDVYKPHVLRLSELTADLVYTKAKGKDGVTRNIFMLNPGGRQNDCT